MSYSAGQFLVVSLGVLAAWGLAALYLVLRADARTREDGAPDEGVRHLPTTTSEPRGGSSAVPRPARPGVAGRLRSFFGVTEP